jgi:hypothetical protein
MPSKRSSPRKAAVRRPRRRSGRGKVLDWLKKAEKSLRGSKFISRLGKAYGESGLPGSIYADKVSGVARKMGYGKRSTKALRLAKRANTGLRKHKLISRAAAKYGSTNMKGADTARKISEMAAKLGYGRRGAGLRLAGGGLGLAGGGMRRRRVKR